MYLLQDDVAFLNDWLNQEDEIAFLVTQGEKKWIAKKQHDILRDIRIQTFVQGDDSVITKYAVEYNLWHVPSGLLPLLAGNSSGTKLKFSKGDWQDDSEILDPWTGWTELRTGANPRIPYFGAGHKGVIHLEIHISESGEIPMSHFGWIGNHYARIGHEENQTTDKFWNKLKRMVKKSSTQIPRTNAAEWRKEVYAFPGAYKEIQSGRQCSLN